MKLFHTLLEHAHTIANHESLCPFKLYHCTREKPTFDEVTATRS